MTTAIHIGVLVFLLAVVAYACVLLTRDAQEPIGRTRAEILSRLADERAVVVGVDPGRS